MRKIIILLLLLPVFGIAQELKDTTTSKTKIYQFLSNTNGLFQKEYFNVEGKKNIFFTAIIVKNILSKEMAKGAIIGSAGFLFTLPREYLDPNEIKQIVICLQYIKDSVNLEIKPDHYTAIHYTTADSFEIGVEAGVDASYKIYFKKRYYYMPAYEVTLNRKDLMAVYDSFKTIDNFLDAHN